MWAFVINLLMGYVSDAIKWLSAHGYAFVLRKLKGEHSLPDFLRSIENGDFRIGDTVTLIGTFSEYIPLTNPLQILSESQNFKFGATNPFEKTDGKFDTNFMNLLIPPLGPKGTSGTIMKWIGKGDVEINHIPTTTLRLNSINDVYCGSLLNINEQYAYSDKQVSVFYSHTYGQESLELLNCLSGDQVEVEGVMVPVPERFRTATSEISPFVVRDDGSKVPIAVKVTRARLVSRGTEFFINQWVIGHFSSTGKRQKDFWKQIVWTQFLKGSTTIQVGGDQEKKKLLPFFMEHHCITHMLPIMLLKGEREYDTYFIELLLRPSLFQIYLGKANCRIGEMRDEFMGLTNSWLSHDNLKFLAKRDLMNIDFQYDQRDMIWEQTISSGDWSG